jgi:hypothetical protein
VATSLAAKLVIVTPVAVKARTGAVQGNETLLKQINSHGAVHVRVPKDLYTCNKSAQTRCCRSISVRCVGDAVTAVGDLNSRFVGAFYSGTSFRQLCHAKWNNFVTTSSEQPEGRLTQQRRSRERLKPSQVAAHLLSRPDQRRPTARRASRCPPSAI